MNIRRLILGLFALVTTVALATSHAETERTYVLVHGSWMGKYVWTATSLALTRAGNEASSSIQVGFTQGPRLRVRFHRAILHPDSSTSRASAGYIQAGFGLGLNSSTSFPHFTPLATLGQGTQQHQTK